MHILTVVLQLSNSSDASELFEACCNHQRSGFSLEASSKAPREHSIAAKLKQTTRVQQRARSRSPGAWPLLVLGKSCCRAELMVQQLLGHVSCYRYDVHPYILVHYQPGY